MSPASAILALVQGIALVAFAPLLDGLIRRAKALMTRRTGPPLLERYRELARLLARESVRPASATWVFDAAPIVSLAASAVAAAFVPTVLAAPGSSAGDVTTVLYLLALGSFFAILAGQDAASFPRPTSSSRARVPVFGEPFAVLAVAVAAASLRATTDGSSLTGVAAPSSGLLAPWRLLAALAFFAVVLAERARAEEPTLPEEEAGPGRAFLLLGELAKETVLLSILASVFVPVGAVAERLPGPLAVSAGVFVLELLVLGVAIAAAESAIARIRLSSVRGYLGAACGVALLAHAVREVFS